MVEEKDHKNLLNFNNNMILNFKMNSESLIQLYRCLKVISQTNINNILLINSKSTVEMEKEIKIFMEDLFENYFQIFLTDMIKFLLYDELIDKKKIIKYFIFRYKNVFTCNQIINDFNSLFNSLKLLNIEFPLIILKKKDNTIEQYNSKYVNKILNELKKDGIIENPKRGCYNIKDLNKLQTEVYVISLLFDLLNKMKQ